MGVGGQRSRGGVRSWEGSGTGIRGRDTVEGGLECVEGERREAAQGMRWEITDFDLGPLPSFETGLILSLQDTNAVVFSAERTKQNLNLFHEGAAACVRNFCLRALRLSPAEDLRPSSSSASSAPASTPQYLQRRWQVDPVPTFSNPQSSLSTSSDAVGSQGECPPPPVPPPPPLTKP